MFCPQKIQDTCIDRKYKKIGKKNKLKLNENKFLLVQVLRKLICLLPKTSKKIIAKKSLKLN